MAHLVIWNFAISKLKYFFRFRWVTLQLVELKTCSDLVALEKQLGDLPRDLDETYDQIISKIDKRYHDDTKKFLQWLAFSTRSLRLDELAEVVVVDFTAEN